MFLGWYDPDRKKPARAKLAEAMERYEEKFGVEPELVLTNPTDAADLLTATRTFPGDPPLPIRQAPWIARWTYYVGAEEDAVLVAA